MENDGKNIADDCFLVCLEDVFGEKKASEKVLQRKSESLDGWQLQVTIKLVYFGCLIATGGFFG